MAKIVFIGAGSFGFTRGLVKDILTYPLLRDATLVLMDIDRERLASIKQAVEIVDDCSLIYTVVGEPDAVTDADATHVGIFNLSIDTGTVYHLYSVAEVESDGSFEGQICGNFQDQVVIVALDSDDLCSLNQVYVMWFIRKTQESGYYD